MTIYLTSFLSNTPTSERDPHLHYKQGLILSLHPSLGPPASQVPEAKNLPLDRKGREPGWTLDEDPPPPWGGVTDTNQSLFRQTRKLRRHVYLLPLNTRTPPPLLKEVNGRRVQGPKYRSQPPSINPLQGSPDSGERTPSRLLPLKVP